MTKGLVLPAGSVVEVVVNVIVVGVAGEDVVIPTFAGITTHLRVLEIRAQTSRFDATFTIWPGVAHFAPSLLAANTGVPITPKRVTVAAIERSFLFIPEGYFKSLKCSRTYYGARVTQIVWGEPSNSVWTFPLVSEIANVVAARRTVSYAVLSSSARDCALIVQTFEEV